MKGDDMISTERAQLGLVMVDHEKSLELSVYLGKRTPSGSLSERRNLRKETFSKTFKE